MMKITSLIVFLCVSSAYSMPVFYDKNTGNVDSWGYIDSEKYLSEYPNLGMVYVKDDDSILKNPIAYLKYDGQKIVLKSKPEITNLKNEEKKQLIRNQIRALKKQESEALSDSYDVSLETTTIKIKVDSLKQEYDSVSQ